MIRARDMATTVQESDSKSESGSENEEKKTNEDSKDGSDPEISFLKKYPLPEQNPDPKIANEMVGGKKNDIGSRVAEAVTHLRGTMVLDGYFASFDKQDELFKAIEYVCKKLTNPNAEIDGSGFGEEQSKSLNYLRDVISIDGFGDNLLGKFMNKQFLPKDDASIKIKVFLHCIYEALNDQFEGKHLEGKHQDLEAGNKISTNALRAMDKLFLNIADNISVLKNETNIDNVVREAEESVRQVPNIQILRGANVERSSLFQPCIRFAAEKFDELKEYFKENPKSSVMSFAAAGVIYNSIIDNMPIETGLAPDEYAKFVDGVVTAYLFFTAIPASFIVVSELKHSYYRDNNCSRNLFLALGMAAGCYFAYQFLDQSKDQSISSHVQDEILDYLSCALYGISLAGALAQVADTLGCSTRR